MVNKVKDMNNSKLPAGFVIKKGTKEELPLVLSLIKELAEYEKLSDEVVASEALLKKYLFGDAKVAEVIIGYFKDEAVGFALFFHNYSTFVGRHGLYLEDLYVRPQFRGKGFGKALFLHLTKLAVQRGCGRMEWSVLNWNTPAINFYKSLDAKPMDEWTVYRLTGKALAVLGE